HAARGDAAADLEPGRLPAGALPLSDPRRRPRRPLLHLLYQRRGPRPRTPRHDTETRRPGPPRRRKASPRRRHVLFEGRLRALRKPVLSVTVAGKHTMKITQVEATRIEYPDLIGKRTPPRSSATASRLSRQATPLRRYGPPPAGRRGWMPSGSRNVGCVVTV